MAEKADRPAITPETKIGALLEAYPELESRLIELAPAFAKLRHPVLRRTVARVTTLRQAAKVGGIGLAELVNALREAAGFDTTFADDSAAGEASRERPSWLENASVARSLDIRPVLERGEQPLGLVLGELKKLSEGEICEVIAPLLPAPLIEKAESLGYKTWVKVEGSGLWRVWFRK